MKLYQVIGSVITHIPCWSDMLTISTPMRPNRPHIPSVIQISKSADTKQTTHPNFGRLASVYPDFGTGVPTRSPFRPSASLRLIVFGEALSRQTRKQPQEEKCTHPSFSRHNQRLLGNLAPCCQSFSTSPSQTARRFDLFSPSPPNLARIPAGFAPAILRFRQIPARDG